MKLDLPWFRFYKEAVDDSKLKLLAYEDRWHFVALLCCKAQGLLENDTPLGRRQVCIKLGLDSRELEGVIRRLAEVELVDIETMTPLAWDKRQFKSDGDPTAADRQRRLRERHALRHASVTLTEQNRTDTDTEQIRLDEEKNKKNTYPDDFEIAWAAYPARPGASKSAALKAWLARLAKGETAEAMTAGAAAYAGWCAAEGVTGKFVKMPETFFGPSCFFNASYTPSPQRGRPTTSLPGMTRDHMGTIPDA